VKTSFDVKPGTYLVRLVVRDAVGAQMRHATGQCHSLLKLSDFGGG